MARMSDEAYELKQEIREQKIVANNARNRRGMAGKGGKVRLASDRLTQKQWEAKNGECKTYRMNAPMTWEQFKEMPDDLKVMYIKAIRNKYHTPDRVLACCMDIPASMFSKKMRELGIGLGYGSGAKSLRWYGSDSQQDFEKWWFKTKAITRGGTLETEGNVEEDLKKLMETLKGHNVRLKVDWEIVED